MKSSSYLIAGLAITLLETSASIASGKTERSLAADLIPKPGPQIFLTENEVRFTVNDGIGEYITEPLGLRLHSGGIPWRLYVLVEDSVKQGRKTLNPTDLYILRLYPGRERVNEAQALHLVEPGLLAQGGGKEPGDLVYFCLAARLGLETPPDRYHGRIRFLIESEDEQSHQAVLDYQCNVSEFLNIEVSNEMDFGAIDMGEHISNPVHLKVLTNLPQVKLTCQMALLQDGDDRAIQSESIAIAGGLSPQHSLEATRLQNYGTTQMQWVITQNVSDLYLCSKVKIGIRQAAGQYNGLLNVSATALLPQPKEA